MALIPITADSAVFHYDLVYGLRAATQFKIELSYIGTVIDPSRVWPSITTNNGQTYTLIEDYKFTLAAGVKLFSIRLQINNDPTTTSDYKVNLKVIPQENLSHFTNPTGMDTSVEFINAGTISAVTMDSSVGNNIDEGQHGTIHCTLVPPLQQETTVEFNTNPPSALNTSIGLFQYSVDTTNWVNIPASRQMLVPRNTSDFYIRFSALENNTMLDDASAVISIKEINNKPAIYGLPLSKTFNIKDKTILPSGTFINWYCQGYKKMGRYSDGTGGYTTALIQDESPDCGFVYAAYGTILSTYCANENYYEKVADGNNSYFIRVKTENVPGAPPNGCNYVAPTANTQTELTPTTLDKFGVAIISNNGLGFASLKRDDARSKFGALWGKWYWEIKVSRPTSNYKSVAIGVATINHVMGNWVGATPYSWAWWPFDGTKYHNDTQTFYSGTVNDQDIVSVLVDTEAHTLEFWLNGVSLGIAFNNLKDEKIYAIVNATNDSYCLFNFGQYQFAYTPPVGFKPGFGAVSNPPPERGTVLRTYCDGYTKKNDIADGKYGFTTTVIETNAPSCGYNPIPAAGTILGYTCQGTTRFKRVADGLGGETLVQLEINSTSCGYVPPPIPALIPTTLDPAWKTASTDIYNNNLTADINGSVRAVKKVYSGKWYWEVVATSTDIIVGVGTDDNGISSNGIIGSNNKTWGLNLNTKALVFNNVSTAIAFAITEGDIVGLSLDFVNQRLKFSINGVWLDDAVFNNLPIVDYYPMISSTILNKNPLPSATIHFGDSDLIYEAPIGHVPGLGTTTTVYPRKGGVYTYYCVGLDYYYRKYDGGGGYYGELYQANSTSCGWRPPDPAGTLKSKYCVGYDQWGKYADGNYGLYDQLIESPSTNCNYKPAGFLMNSRCNGFTRIGTYSDGLIPQGTYDQIIRENSPDCGFVNTDGGGDSGGGTPLDPNLPINIPNGIRIEITPIPTNNELLIINKEIINI